MFAEMRPEARSGGKRLVAIQAVVVIFLLQLAKWMTTISVGGKVHLLLYRCPIVKRRGSGHDVRGGRGGSWEEIGMGGHEW